MFLLARFTLGFANVFCIVAASSLIGGKTIWFCLAHELSFVENSHIPKSERPWAVFLIARLTSVNRDHAHL